MYLSLPMIIAGAISLFFSIIYAVLGIQTRQKDKHNFSYILFALLSFFNFIYSTGFSFVINAQGNLFLINIFNRMTIISATCTLALILHFAKTYYNLKFRKDIYINYALTAIFSILTLIDTPVFLSGQSLHRTCSYYIGLENGILFKFWGVYVILLMTYISFVLFMGYLRDRKTKKGKADLFLFISCVFWCTTGFIDAMTAIGLIDIPPISWIGSILMVMSIAILLVTKVERLYNEINNLYQEVIFDSLTKVYSRSYFEVELQKAYKGLSREDHKLYIIMMDIDDFKMINDTYGHLSGDIAIREVASLLKTNLRQEDIVARYGGDEFIIMLRDIDEKVILEIFSRIKKHIQEKKIAYDHSSFHVTCSFGITACNRSSFTEDISLETIIGTADRAMYLSKSQGKNTINFINSD